MVMIYLRIDFDRFHRKLKYCIKYLNFLIILFEFCRRENRLSAVRELFHKCYSTYGYKTDGPEGILSKLLF